MELHRLRQYLAGMDLFDAGRPVDTCQSDEQRRGWWAALDAQVDAEMPYRDEPGHDYSSMNGPQWA